MPAANVWQELHAYYRLAEILECSVSAVSDELMPNAVGVSCYSTYSHALLLNLADPCAMTVRQIELTDRWLAMWARKVFPYAQQRETEGPVIVIDLDAPAGASLVAVTPRQTGEATRFGYPAKLATSVRGRLKRLASGSNPAELPTIKRRPSFWFQFPKHVDDLPFAAGRRVRRHHSFANSECNARSIRAASPAYQPSM